MSETVTKEALLSAPALKAFWLAEYRLRHNARYHSWPNDKRLTYCLEKAFDAAHAVDNVTRSSRET